jgi:phospholipase C
VTAVDSATPSTWRRSVGLLGVVALFVIASAAAVGGAPRPSSRASGSTADAAARPQAVAASPIQHVVVIFQENHSFDNVLGGLCVTDHLDCDGATTGVLHNGVRVPLVAAPDIVSQVDHKVGSQSAAINRGRMNGFDLIRDCGLDTHYVCYSQYRADGIPTLRTLAENYVISDRTFSEDPVPSWGGHLDLIAGQLDGFQGVGPRARAHVTPGPGWGCDSRKDTPWKDPAKPSSGYRMVPACVPRADGFGPYRPSPVKHIPTILDRLSSAGLSWKLYAQTTPTNWGYLWSVCPSFASCFYDPGNHNHPSPNWTDRTTFTADAAAGHLPSYSAILPSYAVSQHNHLSMLVGDNYIQSLVSAVMNGPAEQWQSTVFFITYDDCGCFYDHVPPPARSGLGIRVPMVIVSPQAKAAYVDHTVASFDSMLAFVEHNWGLAPLTKGDAKAYDYCHSFVFTTLACTGAAAATPNVTSRAAPTHVRLQPSPVPAASLQYMKTHKPDPDDPT